MTWTMNCVTYWISLKQKGWYDESFYNEYDFVCHEVFDQTNPEPKTQSNTLQTTILLHREELT